jgi:peroxidase
MIFVALLLALPAAVAFSSIEGTTNNAVYSSQGAKRYNFAPRAPSGGSAQGPRLIDAMGHPFPPARLLSNAVATCTSGDIADEESAFGNSHLAAAAISFLFHDFVRFTDDPVETVSSTVPACDVPLDSLCNGSLLMKLPRASYEVGSSPRAFTNGATPFLDLSQVYGSTAARSASVRTFVGGRLLETGLPADPRGAKTPAILALYRLWQKEHNRQASVFASANPSWNDERLFQEARKRTIATMQAIASKEIFPLLLDRAPTAYAGYNSSLDPRVDLLFAGASYFADSGLPGEVACVSASGRVCNAGASFRLRDHCNSVRLFDVWGVGLGDILRGLVLQPASNIDPIYATDLRNYYDAPAGDGLGITGSDAFALAILRGRDLSLPTFHEARVELGLGTSTSWNDVSTDARIIAALQSVYSSPYDVELIVGLLAESGVSTYALGNTLKLLVRNAALRARDSDLYWYENAASGFFTAAEIAAFSSTVMADVIARNTDWAQPPRSVWTAQSRMMAMAGISAGGDASVTATPTRSPAVATASPSAAAVVTATPSPSVGASSGGSDDSESLYHNLRVNEVITMKWQPPATSDNDITITFTVTGAGWWGICLNTKTMRAADTWLMRVGSSGVGEALDCYSPSVIMPTTDAQNDLKLLSSSKDSNGVITMTVKRALSTGDSGDAVFTRGSSMNLLFAWNPSTTYDYHAGNTIAVAVDWFAAVVSNSTTSASVIDTSGDVNSALIAAYLVHGLSLFALYAVLMPVATAAMRFAKHLPSHLVSSMQPLSPLFCWRPGRNKG